MSDNVGKEDTVVVTRYGEVIIGCVVLRVVLGEKEKGRRKIGRRGNVRAWTVGLRWKGKGRREGVRMAMPKKGCDGLGSAQVHASEFGDDWEDRGRCLLTLGFFFFLQIRGECC